MDLEQKLETLEDTKAFLRATGCRMEIAPAGSGWAVEMYTTRRHSSLAPGTMVAMQNDEDFAVAIRLCCAKAMAKFVRVAEVVSGPAPVRRWYVDEALGPQGQGVRAVRCRACGTRQELDVPEVSVRCPSCGCSEYRGTNDD